ncbi:MAG: endonuclease domain-containing protein [Prevotellaceae bacterium]|jgi:very-short-patch-repair endonuclease|nr:endonuclease domain-containing protein [Prevotellaceae bacterium]
MRTTTQNPEKGHWGLTQISRFLKMKNESYAEIVLQDSLVKKFPFRFERFVPVLSFIADFYCEKANLVIELGSKTQVLPKEVLYSEEREKELEKKGFKVLKFNNYEIFHDLDRVLNQIERALKAKLGNDLPAKVYS